MKLDFTQIISNKNINLNGKRTFPIFLDGKHNYVIESRENMLFLVKKVRPRLHNQLSDS